MHSELSVDSMALDIKFHPASTLLVSSHANGTIQFHQQTEEGFKTTAKYQPHQQSSRCFDFVDNGTYILSVSKENNICISKDCKVLHTIVYHTSTQDNYLSCIKSISPFIFATGDEIGRIKIWDMKSNTSKPIHKFGDHEDMISSFELTPDGNYLLSSSIDGSISVIDMRKPVMYAQSQCMNEDILSVCCAKGAGLIAAGTQEGIIYLFKWDKFNDSCDRIICGDNSIDSLCKLNDSQLLEGGFDGKLKVIGLYPNKVLRVLNDEKNKELSSILKCCVESQRTMVATSKLDLTLGIYTLDEDWEEEMEEEEKEDEKEDDEEEKEEEKESGERKAKGKDAGKQNFFSGL